MEPDVIGCAQLGGQSLAQESGEQQAQRSAAQRLVRRGVHAALLSHLLAELLVLCEQLEVGVLLLDEHCALLCDLQRQCGQLVGRQLRLVLPLVEGFGSGDGAQAIDVLQPDHQGADQARAGASLGLPHDKRAIVCFRCVVHAHRLHARLFLILDHNARITPFAALAKSGSNRRISH
eukprot:scaffold869_cov160-Ochromonas_danica.AAC.7